MEQEQPQGPESALTSTEKALYEILSLSMDKGLSLSIDYEGLNRDIEVHAIGISRAGNPCFRVWQTDGGSVSGEVPGWKMMLFARVSDYSLYSDPVIPYGAPRPGYKQGDKGMSQIFKEL
jgi:hypothetical protein